MIRTTLATLLNAQRGLLTPSGLTVVRPLATRAWPRTQGLLDITKEIKIDHDNVRDLYERYINVKSFEEKKAIANTLIREMSMHGDAEEVSVYNDYCNLGLKDTIEHNKDEHSNIKKLTFKAEHMAISNEHYDNTIKEAVDAFLVHAREEEAEQFPTLRAKLSPEDSDKIARTFLKSREKAPFLPHPLTPQTGGVLQKATGMHRHAQDKVVEKMQDRQYVPLQYNHPRP